MVAAGCVCRSCGKLYADPGRLKRHLQAVPHCCFKWGRFVPQGSPAPPHPQCPPLPSAGCFQDTYERPPEPACTALAAALRGLDAALIDSDCELYNLVISYIAPLPLLRRTVEDWLHTLDRSSKLYDTAESVSLVLTAQCVADKVKTPKSASVPLMPDVPVWKPVAEIPRVVSGNALSIQLPDPPSVRLLYPFVAPVPLPLATATADWVEGVCQRLGAAAEWCSSRPVEVLIGPQARSVLGPVTQWLVGVGFAEQGRTFTSGSSFT